MSYIIIFCVLASLLILTLGVFYSRVKAVKDFREEIARKVLVATEMDTASLSKRESAALFLWRMSSLDRAYDNSLYFKVWVSLDTFYEDTGFMDPFTTFDHKKVVQEVLAMLEQGRPNATV